MTPEQVFAWFMPGEPPPTNSLTEGCWDWAGVLKGGGYGGFKIGRQHFRAHVVSYQIHHGPTEGLAVLHSCDRPICVHPVHLSLGTQAENLRQMTERGRRVSGEEHSRAVSNGLLGICSPRSSL